MQPHDFDRDESNRDVSITQRHGEQSQKTWSAPDRPYLQTQSVELWKRYAESRMKHFGTR